jgi:general secretion pathway protein A
MYLDYFGLQEAPFSIAPDPRYLFMSERHREALAHLMYGIRSEGGFVLLTGEVGTGKTTVCRCLLEQLPDNCEVAFVLNPKVTSRELLATICDELGIGYPEGNQSVKVFVDRINAHLLANHAAGRHTVVIIDEAQNLGPAVLEQLRLLTNLETNREKLLQIILLGQPEFRDMLARQELRQFSQRITARYHLTPLNYTEMVSYVRHRLQVAGLAPISCQTLFPSRVLRRLYRISGGVPRLVNLLCDRALLGVYAGETREVSPAILAQAAQEVLGSPRRLPQMSLRPVLAAAMVVLVVTALAGAYHYREGLTSRGPLQALLADESQMQESMEEAPIAADAEVSDQGMTWPEQQPVAQSERLAFEALLSTWDVVELPQPGADLCAYVGDLGLRCMHDRGNFRTLEILGHPAVLTLFDDHGRTYHGALISLDSEQATLLIGGEERRVSIEEVQEHWLGEFTLVWRVPPEYSGNLHPGARDPFVLWLARRLADIEGSTAEPHSSELYDAGLVQQVRRFQLSRGLQPDGIVGSKTLIQLGSVLGGSDPRLTASGG